jgi:hypothetical protein
MSCAIVRVSDERISLDDLESIGDRSVLAPTLRAGARSDSETLRAAGVR